MIKPRCCNCKQEYDNHYHWPEFICVPCGTAVPGIVAKPYVEKFMKSILEKCEQCGGSHPAYIHAGYEVPDYQALYFDLIMQVGNKYDGETRHETAKRYLRQAKEHCPHPVQVI